MFGLFKNRRTKMQQADDAGRLAAAIAVALALHEMQGLPTDPEVAAIATAIALCQAEARAAVSQGDGVPPWAFSGRVGQMTSRVSLQERRR